MLIVVTRCAIRNSSQIRVSSISAVSSISSMSSECRMSCRSSTRGICRIIRVLSIMCTIRLISMVRSNRMLSHRIIVSASQSMGRTVVSAGLVSLV